MDRGTSSLSRDILLLAIGVILLILLILSAYISYTKPKIPHKARVIVIFRMDDPQPRWRFNALKRGVDLFVKEEIPLTLGVIPYVGGKFKASEDRLFSAYMRRLLITKSSLIEVALHGLTHDVRTYMKGKSEFAGLPMEEQLKMIKEGKSILGEIGAKVRVFIPPFDTYDNNTIEALRKAGIIVLSARYMNENESVGIPEVIDGLVVIHASQSLIGNWSTMTLNSYSDIKSSFDEMYEKGGVFVLEMHYHIFTKKQALRLVNDLIHYMKSKGNVAFMELGDFGEGYLNGTIRKEDGVWVIGND